MLWDTLIITDSEFVYLGMRIENNVKRI